MTKVVFASAALALLLAGCGYSPTRNALAQMTPQEASSAVKRSVVKPAGVSTSQFKEMGDSGRARTAAGLIRKVWQEACDVSLVQQIAALPTGQSRWRVKCAQSTSFHDYSLVLPETAEGSAQVLQCQMTGPRHVECSFIGRSKTAAN